MDEREEKVYLAALAGLLHDIGKFAQRAGWRKGKHAEVGGEFVQRYVPEAWRKGLYPVMGHHDKPLQGYDTKVVALADRLSAGERADEKEAQVQQLLSIFCRLATPGQGMEGEHASEKLYLPLKPLALKRDVIFPSEALSEQQAQRAYRDLWDTFEKDVKVLRDSHGGQGHLPTYLESLQLLLQRYAWCIPSAYYRSLPDVSLYDHSRTTAALAAALQGCDEALIDQLLEALNTWYAACKQVEQRSQKNNKLPSVLESTEVALLVGGDVSGVQDFIYTITARGATSSLRGRSFYLQLLTEVVARYVLRKLRLPITNLIYQGGGKFYIIARAADSERLREIQQEVSAVLLAHHRGDLYLALGSVPLAAADFYSGRISGKWGALARLLREAKQRRFAELDEAVLAPFFNPQDQGGNEEGQCQVCGREHPEIKADKKDGEAEEVRKCPSCLSYEDLGNDLRRARYLWLAEQEPDIPSDPFAVVPGGWLDVVKALGFRAGLAKNAKDLDFGSDPAVVLALSDVDVQSLHPSVRLTTGRRFLVNVTPDYKQVDAAWLADPDRPSELRQRIEDELPPDPVGRVIKPFSLLEAQARGIKRLGVLRMDLDDGGRLFSDGFVEQRGRGSGTREFATLSRVAALSFAISLYFEGWVEKLADGINERTCGEGRGDTLYSIYSGGDDLFFVGAWDSVMSLARQICTDLTPYAANHPGIHISAGAVLTGGKYPLAQAALEAGAAESQAKRYPGKAAFTFLGEVTPWSRFGLGVSDEDNPDCVYGMMCKLVRLVKKEKDGGLGGPRGLLKLLVRLQEMQDTAVKDRRERGEDLNYEGEAQSLYGPWVWRGYYTLKRMAKRYKGNPEIKQEIEALAEQLHDDYFRNVGWIGLAARWAELLTR